MAYDPMQYVTPELIQALAAQTGYDETDEQRKQRVMALRGDPQQATKMRNTGFIGTGFRGPSAQNIAKIAYGQGANQLKDYQDEMSSADSEARKQKASLFPMALGIGADRRQDEWKQKTFDQARQQHAEEMGLKRQELAAKNTTTSADEENIADMIVSGQLPITAASPRTAEGRHIIALIKQKAGPNWSAIDYGAAKKTVEDFGAGMSGRSARSLNVALNHLDTLAGYADALNSGQYPAINAAKQRVQTELGYAPPAGFKAVRDFVGSELVKAVVATGGGVEERKEARESILAAGSPEQMAYVLNGYKDLLGGQLEGLRTQYEFNTKGMQGVPSFEDIISENVKSQLEGRPAYSGGTGAATGPSKAASHYLNATR